MGSYRRYGPPGPDPNRSPPPVVAAIVSILMLVGLMLIIAPQFLGKEPLQGTEAGQSQALEWLNFFKTPKT